MGGQDGWLGQESVGNPGGHVKGMLWALVPDEAYVLILCGIGLLAMFGFMRGKLATTIVGFVVLPVLIAPFAESLFAGLPVWVSVLALAVFGLVILRGLLELLIGKQAANHAVGDIASRLIRGGFKLIFLPIRLLLGWLRSRSSRT
jgi:hypothetical protein